MRARTIAIPLAVSLALACGAPSALAARSDKKAIWGPVRVGENSAFPIYRRLGVGVFQMDLNWSAVAPTRPGTASDPADPAYRWPEEISYAIRQATRYRMRILLQVIGTPSWANGGRHWSYPPKRVSALGQFLAAASRRYRSVHLWMIWGEPDRRANFAIVKSARRTARKLTRSQARAPHVYARMLDASYSALKRVSRRNLVIGGNTFTWGDVGVRQWIENLRLPGGRPPRMDLYGHNPFGYRGPNLSKRPSPGGAYDFSDLGRLSRLVQRNLARRHHRIKLFLSEWTIPTSRFDDEFNFWVAPRVQARWIRAAWRIVRRSSWIYGLGWIHLLDDPPGQGSSGGLLDYRGNPKPGYYAWKNG
jgi:hypothetical protein